MYNNLIRNTQSTFSFGINTTINGASLATEFAIPRVNFGIPTDQWRRLVQSGGGFTGRQYDTEFLIESAWNDQTARVYNTYIIAQQLSDTAKRFILDTERPDGNHDGELGLNVSRATNGTLTISVTSSPAGNTRLFQVQRVYAK